MYGGLECVRGWCVMSSWWAVCHWAMWGFTIATKKGPVPWIGRGLKWTKNDNTDCFCLVTFFRTLPSSAILASGNPFHPAPNALPMIITSHSLHRSDTLKFPHCPYLSSPRRRRNPYSSVGTIFVMLSYSPGGSTSLLPELHPPVNFPFYSSL